MIRFLADENLNRRIVRAVLVRKTSVDFAIAQEVGLTGSDDDSVLAWAAREQRVVVTHDIRTMAVAAIKRLDRDVQMAGLVLVRKKLALRSVVDDLVLICEASDQQEWIGTIFYLPL